jgi:hypothetical protein
MGPGRSLSSGRARRGPGGREGEERTVDFHFDPDFFTNSQLQGLVAFALAAAAEIGLRVYRSRLDIANDKVHTPLAPWAPTPLPTIIHQATRQSDREPM